MALGLRGEATPHFVPVSSQRMFQRGEPTGLSLVVAIRAPSLRAAGLAARGWFAHEMLSAVVLGVLVTLFAVASGAGAPAVAGRRHGAWTLTNHRTRPVSQGVRPTRGPFALGGADRGRGFPGNSARRETGRPVDQRKQSPKAESMRLRSDRLLGLLGFRALGRRGRCDR
jgi:hypothetical protein